MPPLRSWRPVYHAFLGGPGLAGNRWVSGVGGLLHLSFFPAESFHCPEVQRHD